MVKKLVYVPSSLTPVVRKLPRKTDAVAEKSAARAPIRDVSVDSRLAELERQIWRNRARVVRPF